MSPEQSPPLDLSGTWRAAVADEGLRRSFADPELEDGAWATIDVPGHWRSAPAFAATDGPLLYRRRYEAAPPPPGSRAWLVLDGLFYQGDVWFDGAYLGDTEGYFVRHSFEVTDPSRDRDEHLVAVETTCSASDDRTARRNLTGAFQHGEGADPGWNPGGIWRPVRLEQTGPVRARSLRVLCQEATPERAVVALRAELDSDAARTVRLRTTIGEVDDEAERPVAEGSNFVEWLVTVPQPALWWPHTLGSQPLYDVEVAVEVEGACSHLLQRRTGLRSLTFEHWILSVNGERLFLKGASQGPNRRALAEATADDLRGDVALAKDAGLDLLRLQAHVSRPELYEAADEAGLLLWQDLPLHGGYARSIRPQAVQQAAAAVDLLGHHPSVAIWCGHDEPVPMEHEPGRTYGRPELRRLAATWALRQQVPTWNKTILDRSVRRALRGADRTRPVVAHSAVLPHVGSRGTDSRLWLGWYHGHERDLAGLCRAVPALARFVSGFGAQAVPDTAGFMEPGRWPDLDWPQLGRAHGLQKWVFDRRVPPEEAASFEAWREATQRYQATVVKRHVETLRRLKYRPTGGFCQFSLADGRPAVSWSVLDHERVPKLGYAALVEACRPVIVVADQPPATVAPGDSLALDVHVVSDLRRPLEAVVVDARLTWEGGCRRWRWRGAVPADGCVRVDTISVVVPDAPGRLVLDLDLADGRVRGRNRYCAEIVPS